MKMQFLLPFLNGRTFILRTWSILILFLSVQNASSQVAGDYGAYTSGNWNNNATWKIYNGISWASSPISVSWPNSSSLNCFILPGSTVTLTVSQTTCHDVNINSAGKLYTNSMGSNTYLYVYGNITCDGVIGNGSVFDAISLGIEGSNCLISGSGSIDCSRIRKNLNSIITTNLIIDININLRFGTGSQTQIYNTADGTIFNITLNAGRILNLTGNAGNIGNVAMDGIFGSDISERGGSYTINGTLIISGSLYLTTNNSVYPCTFTIGNTGVVQTVSVVANNSGAASHTLTMMPGGLLQITGTPFNNPFTLVNNNYILNPGSTIEYAAAGIQTVDSNLAYANLKMSGSGNKTAAGPIKVVGNISMVSSAVFIPYVSGPFVYVGGDWTDYSTAGFNEAGSTVYFNGSINQTITCTGGEGFNNLSVIKSGGKIINSTSPATLVRVAGVLDLTNGLIQTTNSSYVLIQSTGSVVNVNDNSFVEGPCGRQGLSPFTFPVGKIAKYRPIGISPPSAAGILVISEYFPVDPQTIPYNVNSKDPTLDHVSRCEYWLLRSNISTPLTVTLSWDSYSCGVSNIPDLKVAAWNTVLWKDMGNSLTTGTLTAGNVTAASQYNIISSNTPFTLASTTLFNPLPVSLLSFTARQEENKIKLEWATATEVNNDFFSIEKSTDAFNFYEIGKVDGCGNSSETHSYHFTDEEIKDGLMYYRLKQVDFDSKAMYSRIVVVNVVSREENNFTIGPNPTNGFVKINARLNLFDIDILNEKGELISSLKNLYPGYMLNISGYANGLYLIKIISDGTDKNFKVFKTE
jgi:hypothetical protein